MLFTDFCKVAQSGYFGCSSQAQYLSRLFKAACITRDYSDDYLKAVYNGTKPFSANMKKHFPKAIDESKIASYYETHIKDNNIDLLIDGFAVPIYLKREKKPLSVALARQMVEFIQSKGEDVDCIVAKAYEDAFIEKETSRYEVPKKLYSGDNLWVEQKEKRHEVSCYQRFIHEWSIQNRGSCMWTGRKLVCINQNSFVPQFSVLTIDVPDTSPNKFIKIATEVDSRGIEGSFDCIWEMQDSEGNNCFPNSKWVFDFTIKVTFSI